MAEDQKVMIQFGCGENKLDGWINHDSDLNLEVLPYPYPDNHADVIFIEHCFEHFSPPHGIRMLEEFKRILKLGGTLRICVPVVGTHLTREHARDLIVGHGHLQALDQNILFTMIWAAGFKLEKIQVTGRKEIDGHHLIIGMAKDDSETLRVEAVK